MNCLHRKTGAFTLIELLVVISVITILAAISYPVYSKVKESANQTHCVANLRNLAAAMEMYTKDYGGNYPVAAQMPTADMFGWPRICDVLDSVVDGNHQVFRCRSDNDVPYWQREGSSYEYMCMLGFPDMRRQGLGMIEGGACNIPVMGDYHNFHGKEKAPTSKNYFFMDGHVGHFGQES